MKEKIKEFLKNYWWIILIVLIILEVFYWYQIRPSIIYSKCEKSAVGKAINYYIEKAKLDPSNYSWEMALKQWYKKDDYDFYYKKCLRENGINK